MKTKTFIFYFLFFIYCNKKNNDFFKILSEKKTNIHFINKVEDKTLFNILYYLYFYNGGGVAIGDINNDGYDDIYFTANNKSGNKLYLNKGNFEFEDITEKAGVAGKNAWCTGVTMADINNDGLLDIYVCAINGKYDLNYHNELFINNGNGTFSEKSHLFGLDFKGLSTQAAFFDFDKDGYLDCYILNQSSHPHSNIVDIKNRLNYDSLSGDVLLKNDLKNTGKFLDVSKKAGIYQSNLGYGLGIGIADLNNDGWEDIYIGNDFHENDYYYINQKNGTFKESGATHFSHYSRFSMGNDIADYNNDGNLDIITVDMLPNDEKTMKTYGSDENPDIYKVKIDIQGYQKQYSRNCLQRNNGNGISFSDIGLKSSVYATDWSWSPLFADFDNDGKKDLFITNGIVKRPVDLDYIRFVSDLEQKHNMSKTGEYDKIAIEKMPDGASHPFLFLNEGNDHFVDISNQTPLQNLQGYFNGAAYSDLNNDGAIDVVVNRLNNYPLILQNIGINKNYISIQLKGITNTFGIGAKVYVYQKDSFQYVQQMGTRGFQSSVSPILHVGLNDDKIVDSILIVWGSNKYQIIKNISTNKKIILYEKDALLNFEPTHFFKPEKTILQDISNTIPNLFLHKENDFLDYNVQYLIPHSLSTRGPKMAVGDINNDGLEDFYICGASNQLGKIYEQTNQGTFKTKQLSYIKRNNICEEVDAIFVDVNKDGYLDLFVVSGGNQALDGSDALIDNLYINDKKGNLIQQIGNIPYIPKNKSCVIHADIDNDGDEDIFIGGLADAKNYGIPQTSYLLLNDGKGNFKITDSNYINLQSIGMVTTAQFTDINKDKKMDLIVTGEWMPIKIFINKGNHFILQEIPNSTGLWQSIYCTDINKDGNIDVLLGNWGMNSKLASNKTPPLKLYVKDFDKNGSIEQILTYKIGKEEYTFLAKDELERALPVLKKAYLTYSEVAGKNVQYMFYDLFNNYVELTAEHLENMAFLNLGDGQFKKIILPHQLQESPIFSYAQLPNNMYLAGGNFYGVTPFEGQYDALYPSLFNYSLKENIFNFNSLLPSIHGEVRDIKILKSIHNSFLVLISINNNKMVILQYKSN